MINLTFPHRFLQNKSDTTPFIMKLGTFGTGAAALGLLAAATTAEAGEAHDRFEAQFGNAIAEAGLRVGEVLAEPEVWCHAIDANGSDCESAAKRAKLEAIETREAGLDKTITTVTSERDTEAERAETAEAERDAARALVAAVQGENEASTQ